MNGTMNVATRWQPRLEGLHRSAHASWLTAALWPSRWRAVFNYAKHCERLHKVNLPISQFKGKDFKGSIHTKSKKKTRLLTCVLCSQILGFLGGIFFKLNIDLSDLKNHYIFLIPQPTLVMYVHVLWMKIQWSQRRGKVHRSSKDPTWHSQTLSHLPESDPSASLSGT